VGELLARHAVQQWGGKAAWVLGLDLPEAGLLVQSRITGAFEAVKAKLPEIPIESFVRIDGRGMRDTSRKLTGEFLARHPKEKGILIAAANDTSALGALDAVKEAKREKHVAIVGQDAIPEAVTEIRRKNSSMIGTISHEVGSYGTHLVHIGLALLNGTTVPPYNYAEHRVISTEISNVMQ